MNDPDPTLHEALRWLKYSGEDLDVASRLMTGTQASPRHACWLYQQAVEKALKAALVLEGVDFPFTHDLDALRNYLPDTWPVKTEHGDLAELTEWAVETRYPGDWPEPTDADATGAGSEAHAIHDSVAAEFRRRGALSE